MRLLTLTCALVFVPPLCAQEPAPWATYRGNNQRTGNTDNKPGPVKPRVLWVWKSKDHFIAAPVPAGQRLLVSGLGAFNVGSLFCLDADPKGKPDPVWSRTAPYLKLPTVSSPSIVEGRLVFGDGMHQTDGAALHCLELEDGQPVWQLPEPGTLVHMEGSPTTLGGKVFTGGGAAGVLCVDMNNLFLEGKSVDLAGARKALAERWKEMEAKYLEEKRTNPEFAVPPSEERLPRVMPKRLWQQGKDKWHVDSAVAVSGDNVLVGSAFLDKEKAGDRALYCLDAGSGDVRWRVPLKLNPWGGPSILGDRVVVTGSTIGYYPQLLKGAKGSISAFDLKGGKEALWQKEIAAGVVGCAALAEGMAIVTATDGKVRAFDLASGERRWIYDAKTPFFAPVAVSAGVAYAADWKAVLHAIDLKNGAVRWTFDVGSDPAVQSPGMIYGGPVVHAGRIYLASCNLEGVHAGQPTFVACIE